MHGKLARRLWQDDVEAMIDGSGSRLSCNVGPPLMNNNAD